MFDKEELKYAYKALQEAKRIRALEALFEKDTKSFELEDFNFAMRLFCLFKTWVCLKLKRTQGSYLEPNSFCILAYDETSCMGSLSWSAVWVTPYLFKDWNVDVGEDGT